MKTGNNRAYITASRRRELADLADAVLVDVPAQPPVDPLLIARQYGLSHSFNNYGDTFDGLLECRARRFHIYCNLDRVDTRNSPRARFTLAHELGHYFVDEHRQALLAGVEPHQSIADFGSRFLVEQDADAFASSLLMPEGRFRQSAYGTGLESVLDLAKRFDTSITSAAVRYATLEIVPCAIIKWNPDGYAWKWLSVSTMEARFWSTITKVENLVAGSPTARALKGESPDERGFFEAGTVAAAWFPWLSQGSYRDVLMIEQALSLGKYGVLTMIRPESGRFDFS